MADFDRIEVSATLNIPDATSQIKADLKTIEASLSPININAKINTDTIKNQTAQIQNQINSVINTTKLSSVPINFNVDATKIKEQLSNIVSKIRGGGQGNVIDYKVNLDENGNFSSIMLKYRNEANEVTNSILKLKDIGNKLPDGTANLQWTETIKSVSQNIEQTVKKTEQLTEAQQKQSNSISELSAKYKLLNIQVEKSGIGSLNTENITGFQNAINSNNIQQATHYLNLLRMEYQQLNAETSKQLPQNALDNMQEKAQRLSQTINEITSKFSNINLNSNWSAQVESASNNVSQLKINLDNFNKANVGTEKVQAFNTLKNSVQDTKKQVNDLYKAQQSLANVNITSNKFESYLKENSRVADKFPSKVNAIRSSLKSLGNETDTTKLQTGLQGVNKQFNNLKTSAEKAGIEGRTALQELGNDIKKMATWAIGGTAIFGTVNEIKDMYSEIVKLDDQMVELRKVTDESEATYNTFYHTANETAKSLGVTTESVIGATAAWAQMGYNLPDSTELAKDSEIFKNISENMTVDEATNSLISTLKAFKISSGDVLDGVISKVNEVGNRFAVTNKDIAEGLERSASSMAVANNSMDQTIALLTAATEVTRDADSAGTALKTEFCLCVQKCA
jgi:hypothetical protein